VIEGLDFTPYRLPLQRSWRSAHGTFGERTGWLVCARAGDLRGHGDCAPLPEAGTEDPEAARSALSAWRARAVGKEIQVLLKQIVADGSPAPCARFAVESALLDLAAQREGLPLRRCLSLAAADSVEVNATLGPLSSVTPGMLGEVCDDGFRVLKVKVGLDAPAAEIRHLTELARHLAPGAAFRLDANGAWPFEEALPMIDALNRLPVEALEEPLRGPDVDALRRLQSAAAFPLALDESLHHRGVARPLEDLPVRRVVLKPAVVGGLHRTLALARRAEQLGIQAVLTSLIESAAGLWPTAQLAAAVASPLAHGLATSAWLGGDLGEPPLPSRDRIWLGDHVGSGFAPRPWRPCGL
jgi:o-succinylbenzoate synthase